MSPSRLNVLSDAIAAILLSIIVRERSVPASAILKVVLARLLHCLISDLQRENHGVTA